MGDAGIQQPFPQTESQLPPTPLGSAKPPIREIHVLVTGFGPFKSFVNNPSYLIASALPQTLSPAPPAPPKDVVDPKISSVSQPIRNTITSILDRRRPSQPDPPPIVQPLRPAQDKPYKIHIHTYPSPVRVSYAPTSVLIPSILNPATNASAFPEYPDGIAFDYVFHIGLASGRESYTLETIAHRDDYNIPDVDEDAGTIISDIWDREGVPESLDAGWDGADVLWRWKHEVDRREKEALANADAATANHGGTTQMDTANANVPDTQTGFGMRAWILQHGMLRRSSVGETAGVGGGGGIMRRSPRKAVVKLSRDAGRFLCEFIFMCSLIYRWKQAQAQAHEQQDVETPAQFQPIAANDLSQSSATQIEAQLGKVAFLHVPNGTEQSDITRGLIVAESAIRSIVGSWEAGWRNPNLYPELPGSTVVNGGHNVEGEQGQPAGKQQEVVGVGVGQEGFEEKSTGDQIPELRNG